MRFSSSTVSAFLASAAFLSSPFSCQAFSPISQVSTTTKMKTSLFSTTEESKATSGMSKKKEDRLNFMKSDQFHRRGFKEVRSQVEQDIENQFQAKIVNELKESNYMIENKDAGVKVYLAKDFGFCWGVERSIALAYEAVQHYPDRTLHITNELIHNPEVNDRLTEMKVNLIQKVGEGQKDFSTINEGDVVILPAFGASYEEMEMLDKKNVEVVDTTCPWVSKVWNTVDMHQRKGLTSVIHGKYGHEETIATTSFCEDYICVKDMKEAEMVADYMLNGGDKEEFLKYFSKAISKGFDPDTMLTKVGLANQTTMYKKETKAIGQLFQKTMMKKYGPAEVDQHYMEFDTICDATQERQDAVSELVENAEKYGLDFILVVGGWDSSNTAHLLEIPHMAGIRSFHINRAGCIGADNTITHRTVDGEIVTEPFLLDLDKDVVMGVTSGASTPDAAVQDSLSQIFLLKQLKKKQQS
ncbi:E-4-hydroxy-3-methyl-but-2-enyl pyrophosphate reductase [Nitzschia inconspicua]|uniref:4-hydroxy-3-methylbut-2-enyl diphosphate reductase n=1 Tax=Nitzschia inconspicua TaxID=303405 RepID=A0A9K3Q693_9STRA|nr:E-4-hydroxy-3-methyl-but-2-enyl pyrophosphate reductase [Nitzschia inconspicua]